MRILDGFHSKIALAMAGKNPWGGSSGDDGPDRPDGDEPKADKPKGPRNPWVPKGDGEPRRSASIEDIFKNRGPEGPRRRSGGGGPGGPNFRLPERPGGKSWVPVILIAVGLIWLGVTMTHQVAPREQGIVTWLGGKYSRTLEPGLNFTAPWPIQTVDIENVSEIRQNAIGEGGENLILTGDQNLVDLSYLVRWNIKDLVQFRFALAEPEETLTEVAESAVRAAVAETELDTVLSGEGRETVELRVRQRMQALLDAYGAGIAVQGVEIARTEAPQQVIEAFNDVLAARQDRERNLNEARRYEQQLLAQAQGGAAEFNEIYEQYRLAPEVTRRRLYYETMESVLSRTDKTVVETGNVTPYLPLPEINRRSRQQATPATPPSNNQSGGGQ